MPAKRLVMAILAAILATSFASPSDVRAASAGGFLYEVYEGKATIFGCDGTCPTALVIPAAVDGYPVVEITVSAFTGARLDSVVISDSVLLIGAVAFANTGLSSLTLGNSVQRIGVYTFAGNALTSLTLPASLISANDLAFYDNLLETVTFEGAVPLFEVSGVFSGNPRLTHVIALGPWIVDTAVLFSGLPVLYTSRSAATVKPTVSGTASSGKTLTAAKGTWTGYPYPAFTIQWYACTTAVSAARATVPVTCKKITGATSSTLKLTSAQRGKYIAVGVTGTSRRSAPTFWLSSSTRKVN
jgi:hypothetical protein